MAWILLIMLSVGPFNENYNGENGVWLTIQMHGEAQCRQAANDVTRTMYIFRELNPNLHVEAICREDLRMVPYVEEDDYGTLQPELDYRECLDIVPEV